MGMLQQIPGKLTLGMTAHTSLSDFNKKLAHMGGSAFSKK